MSKPQIVTITNSVEILLAQLSEIRDGNVATRKEIERLTKLLHGGQREEVRLEAKLNKALLKHQQTATVTGDSNVPNER